MRVVVITPPEPIVGYEQAVARLRLDGGEEERTDVEAMIAAVTAHLDGPAGWLGRALGLQTLEARGDLLNCGHSIFLPYPPAVELLSVKYLDAAGVEQTADLDGFELLGRELVPTAYTWPWQGGSSRREALRIRYNGRIFRGAGAYTGRDPDYGRPDVQVAGRHGDFLGGKPPRCGRSLGGEPARPVSGLFLMSNMSVGKLRRRIRIERPTSPAGRKYAGEESWREVATVWAEVEHAMPSRAERLAEGLTIAARPARVRMRHRSDISANMRICVLKPDGGGYSVERTLRIVGGPATLDGRQWTEVMGQEYSTTGTGA